MKKADITIGADYAVSPRRYMQAGTAAGHEDLVRGTVTGWTSPRFSEPALVRVTLAQPYNPRYGVGDKGRTTFEIATRQVVAPWVEHEAAAAVRVEQEKRQAADKQARDVQLAADQEKLRGLIPEALWPHFITPGALSARDGGHLTCGELLAIVLAAREG